MMIPDDSMTSPSLREMLLQKEPQQIPEKYVESEENNLKQEVQGVGRRFERLHDTASLNERLQLANLSANQPNHANADLPYDPGRVYQRQISEVSDNRCINRQWITVDVKDRKVMGVYCKICLAFATCDSAFTNGFTKFTHIYQRIEEHETSKSHNNSVTAFFNAQSGNDIESLINIDMRNLRRKQICENIDVLKRILDVIKYLGSQALPYKSNRGESIYTLEDRTINHGNFLELVLLLAQYDIPLHMHVRKAIEASKKRKESLEDRGKEKSRGRGNLTAMLSKSTTNKILSAINIIMKKRIVEEIGERKFSVQMDISMDTSVTDQETIIVRYVKEEEVKERLFAVKKVTDSSGAGLFELLRSTLLDNGITMENIVGESFDGAANMRGEYNGVQKHLKEVAPNSVYIWCYAHVLNLAATDLSENIVQVKKLIGLLQTTVNFFSESSKRSNVWTELSAETRVGSAKLSKLQKIGKTRWWSKQAALERIFDTYEKPKPEAFSLLIEVLSRIEGMPNFDSKATFEANVLITSQMVFIRYKPNCLSPPPCIQHFKSCI